MMVLNLRQYTLRPAADQDTQRLANLIHFETQVHRHLDWRPPIEWIGQSPYLVIENKSHLVAALACPPDPPGVAWIRLLAVSLDFPLQRAWDDLWNAALEYYRARESSIEVAAIPLHGWFRSLLLNSGFIHTHDVIVLSWRDGRLEQHEAGRGILLRPMNLDDLPTVEQVDSASFAAIWKNSLSCIEDAYRQSAVASVVEVDGEIAGYQISTATAMGGHLARLAVRPEYQGNGVGAALVGDTLSQFVRRGARTITVNTQHDNLASLALYQKLGFKRTGEEYPVYQFKL
jgi:ribosomal protein S18 acetylase RimI-like enzyme